MGGLLSGITFILVLTVSDLPAFIICKKWQGCVAGIAGFFTGYLVGESAKSLPNICKRKAKATARAVQGGMRSFATIHLSTLQTSGKGLKVHHSGVRKWSAERLKGIAQPPTMYYDEYDR